MINKEFRIIELTESNVEENDLFCYKSKKKTEGYQNKLKWFKERTKEGMKIQILYVKEKMGFTSRGFIEYIPGKYNWRGIDAENYMVIHCLWVVGRHKKKGYGSLLLKKCIEDAKKANLLGVAALTANKWLTKPKIYINHGFVKTDEFPPYFDLYTLKFSENSVSPKYKSTSHKMKELSKKGLTVFYSDQCPYLIDMVDSVSELANELKIDFKKYHINSCEEAQDSIHPYGVFCIALEGEVLSPHYESKKKLTQMIEKRK